MPLDKMGKKELSATKKEKKKREDEIE